MMKTQRSIGQFDIVFDLRPGFISRSVHARSQVSVCSGYDLYHAGLHPYRQTASDYLKSTAGSS